MDPNFSATANFRNVTKWVGQANMARRIPQMMHYAFSQLRSGRRGPVMLEVPTDVMEEPIKQTAVSSYTPAPQTRAAGEETAVSQLVALWQAANSPIIIAGQGIFYAEACDELIALAELTNTPVMTTLNGKSAFPENHRLALGTGCASRPLMVRHFLDKADLVIGLGTSLTRSPYITPIPDGKTIVQDQIPICTIVLNNGVLGQYDNYLPIATAKFGTRNLSGNYAALAQALGGYGERITDVAELAGGMKRAQAEMENGRCVLLEVMTREESVFAKY